jgi:hypothetical protein
MQRAVPLDTAHTCPPEQSDVTAQARPRVSQRSTVLPAHRVAPGVQTRGTHALAAQMLPAPHSASVVHVVRMRQSTPVDVAVQTDGAMQALTREPRTPHELNR